MQEALAKYQSRFVMPDNLIADTMSAIIRRKERRAYIRGLVTASVAVALMIACAVFMLIYLADVSPEPLISSNIAIGATMSGVTSQVGNLFSNPLILMIAGAAAVLLPLDRLLRSRLAMRRQADAVKP